jgi:hypothetical protein
MAAVSQRRDVVPVALARSGELLMGLAQGLLFEGESALPSGLVHRDGFIDAAEEAALLEAIGSLQLREAQYKEYTAHRRVAAFGAGYDFDANELTPAPRMARSMPSRRSSAFTSA